MRPGHPAVLSAVFGMLFAWSAAAQEKDVSHKTLETMRRHVASLRAVSRPAQGEEVPRDLLSNLSVVRRAKGKLNQIQLHSHGNAHITPTSFLD